MTRPVQKVSGLAAGVSYGAADFKTKRDWRHAVQAGKEAAARREQELTEDLHDAGEATLSDEITLVFPAQEDFHPVAHLVVGGLAARLELTYEQLEDLQVAVDALLGCRDDERRRLGHRRRRARRRADDRRPVRGARRSPSSSATRASSASAACSRR